MSDEDGNPHKGNKNKWISKLANWYYSVNPPIFSLCLPFTPETVIIDAMFIINTRPLWQTNIVAEYAYFFLFNRFTYHISKQEHWRFI